MKEQLTLEPINPDHSSIRIHQSQELADEGARRREERRFHEERLRYQREQEAADDIARLLFRPK